jgi:SPP1 gp7 family putative phage head morphogenesis protein
LPIQTCEINGKPGYKWGETGKCYTYTPGNKKEEKQALAKAKEQMKAIYASGYNEDELILTPEQYKHLVSNSYNGVTVNLELPKTKWVIINKQLQRMINEWVDIYKKLVEPRVLTDILPMAETNTDMRTDSWIDKLSLIQDSYSGMLLETVNNRINEIRDAFNEVDNFSRKRFLKSMAKNIGVGDISKLGHAFKWEKYGGATLEDVVNNHLEQTMGLVRNLSDETSNNVFNAIRDSAMAGAGHKEITSKIMTAFKKDPNFPGVFKKARTRAKLIARDQTSKMYGKLTEVRQRKVGVNKYIWKTSRDERVRDSHRKMHGKVCKWEDATVFKYSDSEYVSWKKRSSIGGVNFHPGQDIQCRCHASPIFDDIKIQVEGKKPVDKKEYNKKKPATKVTKQEGEMRPAYPTDISDEDYKVDQNKYINTNDVLETKSEWSGSEIEYNFNKLKNRSGRSVMFPDDRIPVRSRNRTTYQADDVKLSPAEFDDLYANSDTEVVMVISGKYKQHSLYTSLRESSCKYNIVDRVRYNDDVCDMVMHNHPNGACFSGADLRALKWSKQIKVSSRNTIYQIERVGNKNVDVGKIIDKMQRDYEKLREQMYEVGTSFNEEIEDKIANLMRKADRPDAYNEYTHLLIKKLIDKHGRGSLRYRRIVKRKKHYKNVLEDENTFLLGKSAPVQKQVNKAKKANIPKKHGSNDIKEYYFEGKKYKIIPTRKDSMDDSIRKWIYDNYATPELKRYASSNRIGESVRVYRYDKYINPVDTVMIKHGEHKYGVNIKDYVGAVISFNGLKSTLTENKLAGTNYKFKWDLRISSKCTGAYVSQFLENKRELILSDRNEMIITHAKEEKLQTTIYGIVIPKQEV